MQVGSPCKSHLDIIEVQSYFMKYATLEKLREVDNKFVKYAKNDYAIELNTKIEIVKAEMAQFAKIGYVTEQIDTLSNDIKDAISDFITVRAVEQHFIIFDAKLKKMRKEFKEDIDELGKIEDSIDSIQSKMK